MKNGESDNQKADHRASTSCPFCFPSENGPIIIESNFAFAIYDRFPVNPGHALIIPRRHCRDYFCLSEDEQRECWALVNQVKELVEQTYHPDGYNIGINIQESAGQTVPHVHIHLIPRYAGDVLRPHGGIRGVIPDKKEY
jgi:ATP adenylyltransferase